MTDRETGKIIDTECMAVALGGDMNCYGVARTFYEAYGVRSVLLGRAPVFPTANSKLYSDKLYDPDLLTDEALLRMLGEVDYKYPGIRKFVFATNDDYVRHIIHNKQAIEAISNDYIVPVIDEVLFDQLDDKDSFYEVCEKYGLPYPKSIVYDFASDNIDTFNIPFDYPIFIKPASNVIYFNFQFEGKQKGYRIDTPDELRKVVGRITDAGYPDKFVFQEYIDGDDDSMFIYSAYCDKSGKVRMMSGGQILMHDRTPELIGNYNAIRNAKDEQLMDRLAAFLEKIGFIGICHFDVQYDRKRDDYVVYEINIRQGRSNYYMTASGMNYARLLVEDYLVSGDTADDYSSGASEAELTDSKQYPDASGAYFVENNNNSLIEGKTSDFVENFAIADRPFIVSNVSRANLAKAIGRDRVASVPAENFHWFQLASYDRSLSNLIMMKRIERSIMRSYYMYK